MHPFFPYGPLEQLDDNLWHRVGEWKNTTPFKRRMTVVRFFGNQLFVHNPFALTEADYVDLQKLGEVKLIAAPNKFHCSEAALFKNKFPNAKLLVSEGAFPKVSKELLPEGLLPGNWPIDVDNEIECFEFEGTRLLHESVFYHVQSKTLIVTDLCFNMQSDQPFLNRKMLEANGIYKEFGPSRVFKYVFVNDRTLAKASFERILEWDFERVIVNHGDIVEKNAKSLLIEKLHKLGLLN